MFTRFCAALATVLSLHLVPAAAQCFPDPIVNWYPTSGGVGIEDQFGYAVALSGSWAFVGAEGDDTLGRDAGCVYAVQRVGGVWQTPFKLFSPTPMNGAYFGVGVAVDGDVLVVGARHQRPPGLPGEGSAFVFRFDASQGAWCPCAELRGSDFTAATSEYGGQVAISGDTIVVGSIYDDLSCGGMGGDCGAAYVFVEPEGGWTCAPSGQVPLVLETAKLVASTPMNGDTLGTDVAVDGDTIVVGAFRADHPVTMQQDVGAAYVYQRPAGGWAGGAGAPTTEISRIFPDDLSHLVQTGDQFGVRVALHEDSTLGDLVVVGARFNGTYGPRAGAVYAVREPAGGWASASLVSADPNVYSSQVSDGDHFGTQVETDGTRIATHAPLDEVFGVGNAGRAFLFELQGTAWVETHWLQDPSPDPGDHLGQGLALQGSTLIVGNHRDNPGGSGMHLGAAHVFELQPCCLELYCFCGTNAPCMNEQTSTGCVNQTGTGSLLVGYGSTRVATDDLALEATGLPPNQAGIFYMGKIAPPTPIPYGNGLACISGQVFRWPIQFSGTAGEISLGPGIVGLSHILFSNTNAHIQPGHVWNFQAWYRDPTGPCGTGFNFSNAIRVEFKP